jgi:hypothetical protein
MVADGCWIGGAKKERQCLFFPANSAHQSTINITPLSLLSSFARLNVTKHKIEQHR